MCVFQCGAVVKELLAPADEAGSTRGDASFSVSLYRFLFLILFSLCFKPYFSFWPVFFIRTADPAYHALGSIYILSFSPE